MTELHQTKAIAKGETFILPTIHDGVMAYLRRKDENVVLVLLNLLGDNQVRIAVEHEWLNGKFTNVFSGLSFSFNGAEQFEMQGYEYIVYVLA